MSSAITFDFFIKFRQFGENIIKDVGKHVKQANDNMVAFNKTTLNGGAALQKYLGLVGTYLGVQKIKEAGLAAEESLITIRQLQRGLKNLGDTSEKSLRALIDQAQEIQDITGISDEITKEVQASLLGLKATRAETEALTPGVLDFAAALRMDTRSAAILVSKALSGAGTELQEYGIRLDLTKPRLEALTNALKRFQGAAEANVAYPGLTKLRAVTADIVENAGLSGMRYAERFFEGLSEKLAEIRAKQSTEVDPAAGLAGNLLNSFGNLVGANAAPILAASAFLLTTVAIRKGWQQIAAIVNASFVFMTGMKFTSFIGTLEGFTKQFGLINGLWSALAAKGVTLKTVLVSLSSAVALLATAITALWIGWSLGTFLNELDFAGAKVEDWVAATLAELISWGSLAVVPFEIAGIYIGRALDVAVARWKKIIWGFLNWYAEQVNDTWVARKLGIEIDTAGMKESIAEATETLEKGFSGLDEEVQNIRDKAAENSKKYADIAVDIGMEGLERNRKGASAAGAPTMSVDPENLQAQALQKRRERYELETKILAAEAEGNTTLADSLKRQMREQDALNDLGKEATTLIKTRLDLEDQEIQKERTKAAAADKRAALESTLGRLQTERQIAQDRGDQVEVNRLIEVEKGLIQDLIDDYTALAKVATAGSSEQADYLAKIVELTEKLNNTGKQSTQFEQILQNYKDLSDPTKHLQGIDQGVGGGLMSWVNQLGSRAEQVAQTISNTIGTTVSGITDGIMGWVDGTKSWGQAMSDMGNSILRQMLQTIINMGVQWLVNTMLIKTGMVSINQLESQQRAQRVAEENAATGAVLPLKSAEATATGIGSFGTALVFGALALAMVLGAMSAFDVGGFTAPGDKDKPVGIVHADEWVAPKWMRNHPVWGGIIMNLEGVRQRGFSMGGWTTSAPALDPAFALATNLPSQQQSSAAPAQDSEMLSLLKQIAGARVQNNIAVVDSDRAAADYVRSRRGSQAIIGSDRRRRAERRV